MSLPLFVYGTLREGQAQSGLLGSMRRDPARVRGLLYDLPAGYPALALGGDRFVHGELVGPVPDAMLRVLDTYEGVDDGLYRRETAEVLLGLRAVPAWVYVMDAPQRLGGRLVPSGRWRAARRR